MSKLSFPRHIPRAVLYFGVLIDVNGHPVKPRNFPITGFSYRLVDDTGQLKEPDK